MRFKSSPDDFIVEEIVRLPLGNAHTVYRVQKRGITTLQAQARLAAALGMPRSAVSFPALKDKGAQAIQYGTVCGSGPKHIEGTGFQAERVMMTTRPLTPQDLLGNRFTVVLRDLSARQAAEIPSQLAQLKQFGFPNYFDQQRFGSYAPGQEWIGKRILARDAESALRAHLTQPFVGDPPHIRTFKAKARQYWGQWHLLLELAPKPSNFRSVLTFLADHPQDYRRALNLITPRVLSLYLAAYQSLLWNRLAARYLRTLLGESPWLIGSLKVAGELLPIYGELPQPLLHQLRAVQVPFFHQHMVDSEPRLAALSEDILAEEGLPREALRARLLKKAYLAKGARQLVVAPRHIKWSQAAVDEATPNRYKLTISFVLPPGSYATLLLKILAMSGKRAVKSIDREKLHAKQKQ